MLARNAIRTHTADDADAACDLELALKAARALTRRLIRAAGGEI